MSQARAAINKSLSFANKLSKAWLLAENDRRPADPEVTSADPRTKLAFAYATKITKAKVNNRPVPFSEAEARKVSNAKRKKAKRSVAQGSEVHDTQEEDAEMPIRSVQTDPLLGKVREPLTESEMGALCAW